MNDFLQQARRASRNYPPRTSRIPESKPPPPEVLIAENDGENRRHLKELLDLYNVRVLEAENGEDVIELTLEKRPALILLNTELPKLDGYETAQTLRNIESLNEIPIVFLCAETDRAFRKRAFAVGGDSYHIAPLDLERLDSILENFLFRVH